MKIHTKIKSHEKHRKTELINRDWYLLFEFKNEN